MPKYCTVLLFITITILFPPVSSAQAPSINAIPLPVGSGARAIGQGGAFIAVADDATAASWNPGALMQLERPEFSIVGSYLLIEQDFDPGTQKFLLGDESATSGDLNYVSAAYPFRVLGKNFVAAMNYQQKYDFTENLDCKRKDIGLISQLEFESKGGISALTPAIAMQIIPRLSFGVAINVYSDEYFRNYAWRETTKDTGINFPTVFVAEQTFKNFQAVNVSSGLFLDIWKKEERRLTFGTVFHSPYTATVDRITDTMITNQVPHHTRERFEIDYPMSLGAGLGFRHNDALSFSFDMTWTDWSRFKQKNKETGEESLPIGGIPLPTDRKIRDTLALRCGTEYLIFQRNSIIPVRGGLFYDPRPSLDKPTDVYGFSLGTGVVFKRFSIDSAYQFRWSTNADGEDFGSDLRGTPFNFKEHLFLTSLIVYF